MPTYSEAVKAANEKHTQACAAAEQVFAAAEETAEKDHAAKVEAATHVFNDCVNTANVERDATLKQAEIVRAASLQAAGFALAEELNSMKDLEVAPVAVETPVVEVNP